MGSGSARPVRPRQRERQCTASPTKNGATARYSSSARATVRNSLIRTEPPSTRTRARSRCIKSARTSGRDSGSPASMTSARSPSRCGGGRDRGAGAVDEPLPARASRAGCQLRVRIRFRPGEEPRRPAEVAAGGHGDPRRVRRTARRHPGGPPPRRPDEQPRVVPPHRVRAHQDGVGAGAQVVNPVQVVRPGQQQAHRAGVVDPAVCRHGAADQHVRASRRRWLPVRLGSCYWTVASAVRQ